MTIERLWYRPYPLVAFILKPFSWLFRFIVFIRRGLYQLGFKKSIRFPVPVIIVGNLTVGGTGKTPLVIWLADSLKKQGYRPGIVSRGFQGQLKEWPKSVSPESDPREVGDEPVLLASRTACPVVVDPDRVSATGYLLTHYDCNVIISDDGLQHYALSRDIEIAVVDGLRYFGNQCCLPAGPLREPISRLNQVDFVVCHGAQQPGWFSMQLMPNEIYNVANPLQRLSLEACQQRRWQAIAAIGHPERFFLQLKHLGFEIDSHCYPDHHVFSKDDIEFGINNWVMMTEKDAVKCRSFADHRHWCLPVTAQLTESFLEALLACLHDLSHAKNHVSYS